MSEESGNRKNVAATPSHPSVARTISKNSIRWSMAAGQALNMSQPPERDGVTDKEIPDGSDRFSSFNKRRSSQKLLEDINQSIPTK